MSHRTLLLVSAATLLSLCCASQRGTTVVNVVETTLDVEGKQYKRQGFTGEGPAWFQQDGVAGLRFDAKDGFDVTYVNKLSEDTVIHQHGLTPPHALDGVPYMSTKPLQPNGTLHSKFPLQSPTGERSNVGTYFIHSHYGFQHEMGVGAPVIVDGHLPEGYPEASIIESARDVIMFLEDFGPYASENHTTNMDCEHPREVYDYFVAGWKAEAGTFNYSQCMDPGPELDVSYKHHLVNGRTLSHPVIVGAKGGERLRLRVIASTGMSNYKIDLAGFDATVIAVDGQPIVPLSLSGLEGAQKDAFWIAVAQRADIMITVPTKSGAYPIFSQIARSQPYTHLPGRGGLVLRVGDVSVPEYSILTKKAAGMMSDVDKGLAQEQMLKAFAPLSIKKPHWVYLNITGDDGFDSINRHSYRLVPMVKKYTPNPNPVMISRGQHVCVAMYNINADAHAMHLHGHSFQVTNINHKKINGAVRDTLLTPRGGCSYIEFCFEAENPGEWPFHCHMTYHLYAGMLTTFKYA